MKIAWFTPFNKKSAIAKVSKLIVEKLSEKHLVDFWVYEEEHEWLSTSVKIIKYTSKSSESILQLKYYDFVIYNFGNNHIFHGPIYEISRNFPGVAILHDYTLHTFFEEYFKLINKPQLYINLVNQYYGEKAAKLAKKSIEGEMIPSLSRSDLCVQMPLFEPALDLMLGYFLHSKFLKKIVSSKFLRLSSFSYLPYPIEHIITTEKVKLKEKLNLDKHRIVIISTGIVHPVKRIEKFIQAWGKSKNKNNFYYCVLGEYGEEYFKTLHNIAQEFDLSDSIRFLGWATEDVLTDYLRASDIAVNLRFPNTEGCSYSAVEQIAHGLPIICNNSGFYKELPLDIAYKISLDDEQTDIIQTLESIKGVDDLKERSERAIKFSKEEFSVAVYTQKLEYFLSELKSKTEGLSLYEKYFSWVAEQMTILFKKKEDSISIHIGNLLSKSTDSPSSSIQKFKGKVLGVWFGFTYSVELRREGITRFAVSFVSALIEEYNYDIEIWCYEINRHELEVSFLSIFENSKLSKRIKIITEHNFSSKLNLQNVTLDPAIIDSWNLSCEEDNLYIPANKYSEAEVFLIPIIYLSNATLLRKKLIVAAHDLQPLVDYEKFIEKDKNQIFYINKIRETGNALVQSNAVLFSNSKYVLETQIMHYLSNVTECNAKYIYLPGNFTETQSDTNSSESFRVKFKRNKPYLFLATQFRPYKNVILLLKACLLNPIILQNYELVFTGNFEDDKELKSLIEQTELREIIYMAGSLSESELKSFYQNCEFVVVPTLFEGGFPWQALEAMNYGKPVLISEIPITTERLRFEGFIEEITSFMLFNPNSPEDLNNKMNNYFKDKDLFIQKQKPIADRLLSYDWKKAIRIYAEKLGLS